MLAWVAMKKNYCELPAISIFNSYPANWRLMPKKILLQVNTTILAVTDSGITKILFNWRLF